VRIAGAAIAYWAVVFALGFVLGTIRVLWLAPRVGIMPATALELPVMVGASWIASGWLIRRFAIVNGGQALAVGALAFAILMVAECALAVTLMAQSPAQWLSGLAAPHGLLGLAGQGAFAVMPLLRLRTAA
jgi:hypothetical protein